MVCSRALDVVKIAGTPAHQCRLLTSHRVKSRVGIAWRTKTGVIYECGGESWSDFDIAKPNQDSMDAALSALRLLLYSPWRPSRASSPRHEHRLASVKIHESRFKR
jgi:hypothetical protein